MKKIVSLSVIIIFITLMLPACTRVGSSMNGSGKIKDTDLKVNGFNGVHIEGPFVLTIRKAEDFKVILSVDDNLVNRIKVSVERKILNISIEAEGNFFPTSLKLEIEMPKITTLNLSGNAKGAVEGFTGDNEFTVFLSDETALNCSVEVNTLELNVFKGSETVFKGKAKNTVVYARSLSKLDLSEFESATAQIKLTEGSVASLNITGRVDTTLEKQSKFFYVGTPTFGNTIITGGSTMEAK